MIAYTLFICPSSYENITLVNTHTLTAKHRENGIVTNTISMEKNVIKWAQIPGPSSQAEDKNVEGYRIFWNFNLEL